MLLLMWKNYRQTRGNHLKMRSSDILTIGLYLTDGSIHRWITAAVKTGNQNPTVLKDVFSKKVYVERTSVKIIVVKLTRRCASYVCATWIFSRRTALALARMKGAIFWPIVNLTEQFLHACHHHSRQIEIQTVVSNSDIQPQKDTTTSVTGS